MIVEKQQKQLRGPTVVVCYQFIEPDDVVSAQVITGLCRELVLRGWKVCALPSNRGCHSQPGVAFAATEVIDGITIHRIWRPSTSQASAIGRIINAIWMILAWSIYAIVMKPDAVIIGTDPILSLLSARVWRQFSKRTAIAHWCFDLYPEAAIADGLFSKEGLLSRLLTYAMRHSYASCDLIADLGCCMRRKLDGYAHGSRSITLTPWALVEPSEPLPIDGLERKAIAGDAQLCLLYSGSFGRAHAFEPFIEFARAAHLLPIKVVFSVRGHREALLRTAVHTTDTNVSIIPLVPASGISRRLAAADIHLVSLREEWTGTVVPSKFFGALAVGRPVLFAGCRESAIAKFIELHKVGWVLQGNSCEIIRHIECLLRNRKDLEALFARCHEVYQAHFSKRRVSDSWDLQLREIIRQRCGNSQG